MISTAEAIDLQKVNNKLILDDVWHRDNPDERDKWNRPEDLSDALDKNFELR
jgi:hypothetical protein